MNSSWSGDRRLDILVLGPMGENDYGPTSTIPIRDALTGLLDESDFQDLLTRYSIEDVAVHVPEGQNQPEIFQNVLRHLDTADLIVFNLNQKQSNPDRANVFYELGLVHSLGIPCFLVVQEGVEVPFYVQGTTQYRVLDFAPETLVDALRDPLADFLDTDKSLTNFINDRVTQFYGLPVVDISAAVGLATGYYENFLSRLLTESGFLSEHSDFIKAVVYVRPTSIRSTYQEDFQQLQRVLAQEGLRLERKQLQPPKTDNKGPIWFEHVDGIILDVPRTIYPLRRSPRLIAFMERNREVSGQVARRRFDQRQGQIEENLLDRVENALRYHIRFDGRPLRESLLHFTTVEEAPATVRQLQNG
jgi:nucleoside 2-deoxyribosyltransferase